MQPGVNLDFFQIPGASPQYSKTEIFQTTVATAFNDTPQTEAFMKFIESTEAQTLLASADHWTVANKNVPTSTYKSVLLQRAAKTYFGRRGHPGHRAELVGQCGGRRRLLEGRRRLPAGSLVLDTVLSTIQGTADGG